MRNPFSFKRKKAEVEAKRSTPSRSCPKCAFLIKRGHAEKSRYVPELFELVYDIDTESFMVGDGITMAKDLKHFETVFVDKASGYLYAPLNTVNASTKATYSLKLDPSSLFFQELNEKIRN